MQRRCVCTCMQLQASQMQIGRIVNKIMKSDSTKKNQRKKRHDHTTTPIVPMDNTFKLESSKPVSKQVQRRVSVLNKVFMKHITDLMSTGEVAPQLIGKGIEVTHIKVAPDYSLINVYWFVENEKFDDEHIEKILKTSAGHLQHELSQLHVIGIVPPVHFIKNKNLNVIKEVEKRLSTVNYGEDFEPTTYISHIKTPILKTSLSSDLKSKISKLACENLEEETYEIEVPSMRQDVLGFDHFAVMQKIRNSLSKAKAAANKTFVDAPVRLNHQATSSEIASFLSSKDEKKMFKDFLKKRLVDEKRRRRLENKRLQENDSLHNYNCYDNLDDNDDYTDDDNFNDYEYEEQYKD